MFNQIMHSRSDLGFLGLLIRSLYVLCCTFKQVHAKCFLYFIYYLYILIYAWGFKYLIFGISYIRTMRVWPVNIAPFSTCRSIVCKTGEVSCPLYTRVWVPLGWGGWVYTCVLNVNI